MEKQIIAKNIPNPKDIEDIEELNKYSPLSYTSHQYPVVWESARGSFVLDRHGNRFLDFTSGIFVTNGGHSNINMLEALQKQIDKELLFCYTFPCIERIDYLKELTRYTNFQKAFLLSAGTEATECAIKIMLLKAKTIDINKNIIISFSGAMHGKTMLAEQLKGNHEWAPINYKIWHLPFPNEDSSFEFDISTIPTAYREKIAGFIIESYRGWDAKFLPLEYVQNLCKYAKKIKALVCFDEIQAGMWRTGKKFGYEWYNVKPDLVCMGKGLGGGVPISAVLGSGELLDLPSDLSSTNSANPLVCSVALGTLKFFKDWDNVENHIANLVRKGSKLLRRISSIGIVKAVNGRGLVYALIFKDKNSADLVGYKLFKRGLLTVNTGRESIKIAPPITISEDAWIEGLELIVKTCNEMRKEIRRKVKINEVSTRLPKN